MKLRLFLPLLAGLAFGGATALNAQDSAGGLTSVQVSDEGQQVYEQICQACHMADAKGSSGAGAKIPALAGNPKLADSDYPVTMLLKGRGGMPWFTEILDHKQMAAVVNYVRGHFNAYPGTVTAADVDRIASSPPPKPDCMTCGN